jgi:hypothetical protein
MALIGGGSTCSGSTGHGLDGTARSRQGGAQLPVSRDPDFFCSRSRCALYRLLLALSLRDSGTFGCAFWDTFGPPIAG